MQYPLYKKGQPICIHQKLATMKEGIYDCRTGNKTKESNLCTIYFNRKMREFAGKTYTIRTVENDRDDCIYYSIKNRTEIWYIIPDWILPTTLKEL